ncbi:MAG: ferritin-like domain-containing protein [Pseudomonadales bacterium]|jgi:hypothetical protein|nr:hypothetical protein [Gammaproteobacteria bacterium]MDP6026457.1 ferritin-like domain-containing protein [Pseudomonadales bacterium]MDP6316299.1 ferritin-like domain-containing protein [Pseudomonadales bacterium]MDP7313648.1 ferritin-like domain-containing protein [Pseudomonadales bacterium]|tara:strand:+ start:340 stop:1305 length:966 start_codon:yes stop_codon:yes gene_type:complete
MKLQIETTCPTQWKFEYESSDPQLDDLYERAKTDQWNVSVDIDWSKGIREDQDVFKRAETPITKTKFFGSLSKQTQKDLLANQAAFMLSQFLHGEQGALLCCGQLVDSVPSVEGKLYAATQVMDEARHVEVFHRYLGLLDRSYPVLNGLKNVLDAILAAETWQAKCVGMQIMVESLAMGTFRNMMVQADDPILQNIVRLTAQDEARHVAFGILSLSEEIPKMPEEDRVALEDFALAAIGILRGGGDGRGVNVAQSIIDAGIDPVEMRNAIAKEREEATGMPFETEQKSVVHEYMVPNLEKVGLISARIRPKYEELGLIVAA